MRDFKRLFLICIFLGTVMHSLSQGRDGYIHLSELDLTKMSCVMGVPKIDRSIRGDTMKIGGVKFERGVGTHAYSRMLIGLHKQAKRITGKVGLDDAAYIHATISFYLLGDKKVLWASGPVRKGEQARPFDISLEGIEKLGLLVTVNRVDISENYADWADVQIAYRGEKPIALVNSVSAEQVGLLTPAAPKRPNINSPAVYGVSPGADMLYRIPTTGQRPIQFVATGLPQGLRLDSRTGIISGKGPTRGEYTVSLLAKNKFGESKKKITIVAGDQLALTPPMGWNSWYIHYTHVSDSFMRLAADAMVSSGMADYGYQYVNIDDCWMNRPTTTNADENGAIRDQEGVLQSNRRFPNMPALTSYIHSKGLKAGIYSSPGPKTCAGYAGSYQHEFQDAKTFANWGFDFLKYDWCSYSNIAKNTSLPELKAPFLLMGDALRQSGRDIVYNLCQYGMGEVWKWGGEAGHSWRTGPDLGTSTGSFLPGFWSQGLNNSEHWSYAQPGRWNDPDYITIGWVGNSSGKPGGRQTSLTHNEQYAYMSMWSLMASPLFFSGDMSKLDAFTLNVLCNNEVIQVNQDALGKQGRIVRNDDSGMLMVKELADGSRAIGLFNFPGRKDDPTAYFAWDAGTNGTRKLRFTADEIGIDGKFKVRNVWTQRDLGNFKDSFEIEVPYHGVQFLKISQ